jgi:polyhydroxybutyrate depolymerase
MSKTVKRILLGLVILMVLLPVVVYVGVGPSLTCLFPSSGPLRAGPSTRVVVSGGAERCYLLYTPPGFDPAERIPVVIALHGLAGNPQGFRGMTGWEEIADRETLLVAYPHGSSFPLRWNTSPAFRIEATDDVQFVADLITDLGNVATLDEDRVYVAGFSNGAGMADLLACDLADRVAAVGLVQGKGENDPALCAPSRPVPVIAFFGMDDPIASSDYPAWFFALMNLSPDPEDRAGVPLATWVQGWVRRNGCDPLPQDLPRQGDAAAVGYTECQDGAEIHVYSIPGGGHTWPGGENLPFFGGVSPVNASELIWSFFEDHPRTTQAAPPMR